MTPAASQRRAPTVEQWMATYLTTIAPQKLKPRSLDDYWPKTRNDIVPGIGKHRLDRLRPEHLDELYLNLHRQGHAPSHVLRMHRIISRALKIAERRQLIGRNVATLVDAPTVSEVEITPLSQDEAKAVRASRSAACTSPRRWLRRRCGAWVTRSGSSRRRPKSPELRLKLRLRHSARKVEAAGSSRLMRKRPGQTGSDLALLRSPLSESNR